MQLLRALYRATIIVVFSTACLTSPAASAGFPGGEAIAPAVPDAAMAARMFETGAENLTLVRDDTAPASWLVHGPRGPLGHIASTWEIAGSLGYSGRPIDILVAVGLDARIAGAELIAHNEPILTLGISTEDIADYVSAFAGLDLKKPRVSAFDARGDLPPIIARATVSTGVIRDAILRTARTVALGRGLVGGAVAKIDRVSFSARNWDGLVADGALVQNPVTLGEARAALAGAKNPPPDGGAPFLDLWLAVLDPRGIGENLLGAPIYGRAMGMLGPEDSAIFVASRGLHSHRGTAWRQTGVFDRIEVIQGARTIALTESDYLRIDKLEAPGAPEFKEMSVFRLAGATGFDPALPFRIEVTASRPAAAGGDVSFRIPLTYHLPRDYLLAAAPVVLPEDAPLWQSAWQARQGSIIGVGVMLAALAALMFLQEPFARRPGLWRWGRIGYLSVTLVWLGWIAGGQLSVVQVVAFLQSLLSGFHWETFLIEPVIFLLWGFVALGLLFWGRGVYCGWLCPFGALQELTNEAAQRLGVPQIAVPFALHERLWAIKYTLFLAILGLSFYSMQDALILAEVEPFKTAMSLRFMRAWPFVLFVIALLAAGLFIERFYCRYLCPLGAALAIPAKLKLFDWLNRRPQCGRECRLCETKCTVGAIDPIGRINPNECVLCLRCQMIYHDANTCTVLKMRAARASRGGGTS
ncbi:MAG TPA: 4Fe-4S binding protein [Thermohalobaculum sp.]|nr:4Fe-4S binding protein [Thermohalobaculum sp.]